MSKRKSSIILLGSNLETTKSKRGIELIDSDNHKKLISQKGMALEDFRPDVTHQSLLALLDSPLNKAGLL